MTFPGTAGPSLQGGLILGTALLGFGLRAFRLGEQSLWYDEAFSILLAARPVAEVIAGTARDTMPPLYYLLLHFWDASGGDFWVRFPSTFMGTLCIPLTYALGTRLLGGQVGLLAALFTALAPFQVYFGQETRMYALLGALSLLAGYWFLRMRQETSPPSLVGKGARGLGLPIPHIAFIGSGVLLVYTHALAWFTVGALGIWVLTRRGRSWEDRGTVVAFLGLVGLYLPWVGILVEQAQRVQSSFWTAPPTPLTPFASLYVFSFGPFLPQGLAPIGMAFVLFLLAATLVTVRSHPPTPQERAGLGFSLLWLGIPLALSYLLSQVRPIYLERTLIGASYGLFIVLAWGLLRLRPRPLAWGLGAAGLALAALALGRWYGDPAVAKPPLRAVVVAVAQGWREGDIIVHTGDGSYLPFRAYLPSYPQALLAGDPEHHLGTARAQSTLRVIGVVPVPAEQAAAGHRRAWLALAPDHSADFQHMAARDFGRGRTLVQERTWGGITLFLYE